MSRAKIASFARNLCINKASGIEEVAQHGENVYAKYHDKRLNMAVPPTLDYGTRASKAVYSRWAIASALFAGFSVILIVVCAIMFCYLITSAQTNEGWEGFRLALGGIVYGLIAIYGGIGLGALAFLSGLVARIRIWRSPYVIAGASLAKRAMIVGLMAGIAMLVALITIILMIESVE